MKFYEVIHPQRAGYKFQTVFKRTAEKELDFLRKKGINAEMVTRNKSSNIRVIHG